MTAWQRPSISTPKRSALAQITTPLQNPLDRNNCCLLLYYSFSCCGLVFGSWLSGALGRPICFSRRDSNPMLGLGREPQSGCNSTQSKNISLDNFRPRLFQPGSTTPASDGMGCSPWAHFTY
ncbi:predicted protein [Coccidioides posadasii str. Silveira]|uniref:Predicted protein n=2 Tax=Coccidioides posadasii TaxID=199306 RepID=E9DC04_COCPS|nr:predicted protein [Coccidioides posadasii str. Silveira]KMM67821.1 hypothetical protein CPAG_04154 [Coccidioides posadasii RMSCC 3488]